MIRRYSMGSLQGARGHPGKNSLRSAGKNRFFSTFAHANGLVAQLEERLNGIEEVVSSNLIGSTNLFTINKLYNIRKYIFDGPPGVQETGN